MTTSFFPCRFNGIYMVHGQWVEMFAAKLALGLNLTTVFRPFADYLGDVATWLAQHNDQIVFIFDEGSAGPQAVGPIYRQLLNGVTDLYVVDDPTSEWPNY